VRQRVTNGSPYEASVGFCRAVRVGNRIIVSGTAPIADDGSTFAPGDAYAQAKRCLEIIERAIAELGGAMSDVVRSRVYITDAAHFPDVARAHGEAYGSIKPAATMVVCSLLRDDWCVEIEAEAIVG
jgi:enamine deaminase RidA (YjgF/YER057c/UK114 family)